MADPLDTSDKYSDVRRIAVGGMGEVLIASYTGDHGLGISQGRLVLKRTLPRHPNRVHQNEMLLEEGRIGLRLLHQNLVETFAVDRSGDDPLLLMEFLGGKSMAQLLGVAKKTKTPLPVELALKIARDVACGLHFAHTLAENGQGLGLVHRDVSPANIFATYDGRVKVIDFGVAKAKDSEIKTSTGILKGKIGYMSPEHAGGQRLTPSTDMWSIGVVLWEMLVADRLFAGTTPAVTLYQITHGEIEVPSKRRPDLPAPVEKLVMHLLQRDRANRVVSGAQLVREIDALGYDLKGVDVGAYLRQTFPADSENAAHDVRIAATRHGRPAPFGLVDGAQDADETIVRDNGDLMRLAREISGEVERKQQAQATRSVAEQPTIQMPSIQGDTDLGPPVLDDAPTRALGIDFNIDPLALRSDEGEAETLVDDGRIRSLLEQNNLSSPSGKQPPAPAQPPTAESDAGKQNSGAEQQLFGNANGDGPVPQAADETETAVLNTDEIAGLDLKPAMQLSTSPAPVASAPSGEVPDLSDATDEDGQDIAFKPTAPRQVGETPPSTPTPLTPQNQSPPPTEALEGPTPGPRDTVPVHPRSVGTFAVALASFGAIAMLLGVIFSFVAHQRAAGRTPQVFLYAGASGTDVIVARVTDAPEDMRKTLGAVDLANPIARVAKEGPRKRRDPAAFKALIVESGIYARAQLPTGGRKTAAALPPAIVLLSLLALAMALPSFIRAGGAVTWALRVVLLIACGVVGFFGVTKGVLSWPGTAAYNETGPPPKVDAAALANKSASLSAKDSPGETPDSAAAPAANAKTK